MAINIQMKQDVSYLFSGLNTNQNNYSGNLLSGNWLSDYASIKNGTYGKLMKAYFSTDAGEEVSKVAKKNENLATSEEAKATAKVQSASDALKDSTDALLETGKDSLFVQKDITAKDDKGVETTTRGYDVEEIYKAVSSFVNNYNAVITAAGDSGNSTLENRATGMVNDTIGSLKSLKAIGITMNENNGILTLDKDAFMTSDMEAVKKVFNGTGSYGYKVSTEASMLNYTAQRAANSSRAYTASGQYGTGFSSGNLFESWF